MSILKGTSTTCPSFLSPAFLLLHVVGKSQLFFVHIKLTSYKNAFLIVTSFFSYPGTSENTT